LIFAKSNHLQKMPGLAFLVNRTFIPRFFNCTNYAKIRHDNPAPQLWGQLEHVGRQIQWP